TFGANRPNLDRLGRGGQAPEINRRAVALAREAAGAGAFVLGSIGPGVTACPASETIREQAEALIDPRVGGLGLETPDDQAAASWFAAMRGRFALPVLVSLTFRTSRNPPGLPGGERPRDRWREMGAAALGSNCLDLVTTFPISQELRDEA